MTLKEWKTNDTEYRITPTTFVKTSRLPFRGTRPDGTPFVWFRPWNHERITNEANALKLVSESTRIPVPKLISHGKLPDGRRYLETEFVEGVTLNQFPRNCSKPSHEKHVSDGPCEACSEQAYLNASNFIQNTVLPQLANLKSRERGINGFVMPPSWLQPAFDDGIPLQTWPLHEEEYVFQHGDIVAHNIMMNESTLEVQALIDWEYAGYFPPGMEKWPRSLDHEAYKNRCPDLDSAVAEFLSEEAKLHPMPGDRGVGSRLAEITPQPSVIMPL